MAFWHMEGFGMTDEVGRISLKFIKPVIARIVNQTSKHRLALQIYQQTPFLVVTPVISIRIKLVLNRRSLKDEMIIFISLRQPLQQCLTLAKQFGAEKIKIEIARITNVSRSLQQ